MEAAGEQSVQCGCGDVQLSSRGELLHSGLCSCMHGERWQLQQRSPVEERETDDARVGGTDERELAEYKLEHVDLEVAEKGDEILRIERC